MKKSLKKSVASLLVTVILLTMLSSPMTAVAAPVPPAVSALGAVVIDYETGAVLYDKNKDAVLVPASMTKVMTAYIIFEEFEAGRLQADTPIPISANAAAVSRNASYPMAIALPAGGVVAADTLLKLILIPSASASCIAMAEYIAGSEAAFVQRMNETAVKMGIAAQYVNCHGARPNYITPASQAVLTANFIRRFPAVLAYTNCTSVAFNGYNWRNTNGLLPGGAYFYPGADGFKTGTIAEAGYCLTSTAVRNGKRLICVVMKAGDNRRRHTDSIALLDYGFTLMATGASQPAAAAGGTPLYDVSKHWVKPVVENLLLLNADLTLQNGAFRPDAPVTVAEFNAMLYSALRKIGVAAAPPQADAANPSLIMTGDMVKARIAGFAPLDFVVQTNVKNHPEQACTRADAAEMVNRLVTTLYMIAHGMM